MKLFKTRPSALGMSDPIMDHRNGPVSWEHVQRTLSTVPMSWRGCVALRGREKDRTEMPERGKKENCWGYVRKRTNCWGYVKKKSLSKAGTLCHRACGSNKKAQVRSVPCGGPTTSVKREPSETLRNK